MEKFIFFQILILLSHSCNYNPLVENEKDSRRGEIRMSIDMTQAPSDVSALAGVFSRDGFDSVFFKFEIIDNKAEAFIENIEQGNWELYVKAMNNSGVILYEGSSTVTIVANRTNYINLHLDPTSTTGSIKVTVTWGERIPKQPILLMAQNRNDEWRIISLMADGSEFKDLFHGYYPFWVKEDRSRFYFRSGTNIISVYDYNTDSTEHVAHFPYIINFLRYSDYSDLIVYDYKINDFNWNIGTFSIADDSSKTIIEDDSWNKRPVPLPNSDLIYYQSNISGNFQIYKTIDGSDIQQVTFSDGESAFPSFNKDGSKLIYSFKNDDEYAIIQRNLDSDNETVISFRKEVLYPVFSKDGNYIIYILVTDPNYGDREMFVMKADGTEKKKIFSGEKYYNHARPITW